jgi:threo-3-hydroxy-L-aspartate ammonia-lyase
MSVDLSLEHVRDAARRLAGRVWTTPVIRNPTLDARAGRELFLKAENLQKIGAFKARGALHAVLRLPGDQRARGVVTYSSGNHAQAVALAAREFDIPAWIAMPTDAPAIKIAGVRALGAEIVFAGTTSEDRHRAALELVARHRATMIEPFDDPDIIAGQGTATLELCEHVLTTTGAPLDALVVPVGGGGLLAGSATAAKGLDAGMRVIGVEPEAGDDTKRSLEAGHRVTIPVPRTIADGQAAETPGELTFSINRRLVDEILLVSDDEVRAAMRLAFERLKTVVEPSGATGLAAVLKGRVEGARRIGVILSGGNIDARRFAELCGD